MIIRIKFLLRAFTFAMPRFSNMESRISFFLSQSRFSMFFAHDEKLSTHSVTWLKYHVIYEFVIDASNFYKF